MVNINILTIFLFFAFLYYFNRFNELRRTHKRIFDKVNHLWIDNQKLRVKMKELQSYKNDVSKTFKILDTELNMINEHLKIRQEHQPSATFNGNVSLLTPEILTNLMENINQEEVEPLQLVPNQEQQEVEDVEEAQEQQEVEDVEEAQEQQEVEDVEEAQEQQEVVDVEEAQEVEEVEEVEDAYLEAQQQQEVEDVEDVETGREEISNKDLFQLHPFDNDLSQYFINISENNTEQSSIKELVNEVINNVVQ
jgi:hypothetical protein